MKTLLIALLCAVGLMAQQSPPTATTLALGISTQDTVLRLSSTTGLTAGQQIYIDREMSTAYGVSALGVRVYRGTGGILTAHVSGTAVYYGTPDRFLAYEPAAGSPCSAFAGVFPNPNTGNTWSCTGGVWVQQNGGGTGGGSGSLTIQADGVSQGTATALNVLAGTGGVVCTPNVSGGTATIQCNPDTSILTSRVSGLSANNPQICTAGTASTTAYIATCTTSFGSYATKQWGMFYADVANSTTTPSVNFDGAGPKTIVRQDGTAVAASAIGIGLHPFWYDGTNVRLMDLTAGGGSGAEKLQWAFCTDAPCSTSTDIITQPQPVMSAFTPSTCTIAAGTAPTGAGLIVNVKKNGSSAQSMTLAAGSVSQTFAATFTGAAGVTGGASADVFTASITQVGSTVAGAKVTVSCR